MAKRQVAHSESIHLDPDSSYDLPDSSIHSSPTVPSILGLSSPLVSTSTPDSSFLTGSLISTQKGLNNYSTSRWSSGSVLGKLVEDDWKKQTEAQRRALLETPSKLEDHGEQNPFSSDSANNNAQPSEEPIQQYSQGLYGATSEEETAFDLSGSSAHGFSLLDSSPTSKPTNYFDPQAFLPSHRQDSVQPSYTFSEPISICFRPVRSHIPAESPLPFGHLPALKPANNVDTGMLSSFGALRVNDYSSFNNPPSSGSDDGSMAYLSPFRRATEPLKHDPSPGANSWTGTETKGFSQPAANATEPWSRKPSEPQTTNRFTIPVGTSSQAPYAPAQPPAGLLVTSSIWAPRSPNKMLGLPPNPLIQQHTHLGSRGVSPPRPPPHLPPIHTTSDSIFHPMESRPLDKQVTGVAAMDLMVKGFSPNYRGNPDLERNRSAPIPPDQNCSLFITGLAPTLTTAQLLATIRDVGRVYATHINGPEPERGHFTCAAKVVFFERRAADRFYARYAGTGFRVAGDADGSSHIGRVVWNRIRSAEQDVGGRKSRVLLISGPPGIVNKASLMAYFDSKIQYQVDEVLTLRKHVANGPGGDNGAERALVEFRFGSYRCQSEAARMALSREFKEFGVFCDFGPDPCDLTSTSPSGNDNHPALASVGSQPDENMHGSDHSNQATGLNWFYNAE